MGKRALFRELLAAAQRTGVEFIRLDTLARELLARRETIPVCDQHLAEIDGRSGNVAVQAAGEEARS